jgi:PAS domain S-box-containing protein
MEKNTLLIIDDTYSNVKFLHSFLSNIGFNVLIAEDGKEGIQVTKNAKPDLILLDVMMPNMDGFEVCQYLKSHKNTKDIPIIFMTALTDTKYKLRGFEVGATDYITKPFQQKEVLARINAHITIRQQQQLLEQQNNELNKAHNHLLAILNQLSIGTVLIDAQGKILFINEACRHFEGVAYEHALNKNWLDVFSFDHISRQKIQMMLSLPDNEQERVTLNWETASGQQYWVEIDIRHDPNHSEQHLIYIYDVSEMHKLREKSDEMRFGYMVGNSPAMLQLYNMIEQVSQGDWTVLITGETGSGKELVARSIHIASPRREAPFIAINCAGLSESLLNSQLFGHRRGAFTGAVSDQPGFFEAASEGTLFLDEIGDIPMTVQTTLLRVLQEREIIRLGDVKPRKINTRILVATHKDLEQEVAAGRFREDLLYRIRVARILVPSLRERKEDIPLLVNTFLAESRLSTGKTISHVSDEALQLLIRYDWPGNIRQLKHTLDYAVVQVQHSVIQIDDLPPEITHVQTKEMVQTESVPLTETQEREQILVALRETKGNRSKAAKLLGISRATFYRRLEQLEIDISKDIKE